MGSNGNGFAAVSWCKSNIISRCKSEGIIGRSNRQGLVSHFGIPASIHCIRHSLQLIFRSRTATHSCTIPGFVGQAGQICIRARLAKGGPTNGGRSRIPIQGNLVPYRHGSSRAIQGDFLVGIAAQGHGVIQGDLVVHRPICGIRCSYNICILTISADGYGLGGDILHIADIGGIGFCFINRVAGFIIPRLATGNIGNLLIAAADATGGDAGTIGNSQACTV